jgi:hypothetical protein
MGGTVEARLPKIDLTHQASIDRQEQVQETKRNNSPRPECDEWNNQRPSYSAPVVV